MILRSRWNISIVYTKKTAAQVRMAVKEKLLFKKLKASATSATIQGIDPMVAVLE